MKYDFKIKKSLDYKDIKTGKDVYVYYITYKVKGPRKIETHTSNNYKTEKRAILELNKLIK